MAAVKAQNVPLVQLLLQRKADVNGQETKGLRSKGGVCLKYFFFLNETNQVGQRDVGTKQVFEDSEAFSVPKARGCVCTNNGQRKCTKSFPFAHVPGWKRCKCSTPGCIFDGKLQLVRQLLNAHADPNLRDCHGQLGYEEGSVMSLPVSLKLPF